MNISFEKKYLLSSISETSNSKNIISEYSLMFEMFSSKYHYNSNQNIQKNLFKLAWYLKWSECQLGCLL